jgi:dihydropteroate synthase
MSLKADVKHHFVFAFGKATYDLATRTHIMGILNVTPDSFSDGGKHLTPQNAVQHARRMVKEGADMIDVGGESTRPGAEPVSPEEEIRRTVPVIERLAAELAIPISIDTHKSQVADAALRAGASVVNDITGMTFDKHMADVVARHKASVVLMHIQGTPRTMQQNPHYSDVVAEVKAFLLQQAERAHAAGIRQVIIDPGIGFGKTLEHNVSLVKQLREIADGGYPVLVGPSRKSFIGAVLDVPVGDRLEGTATAVAACILNGAHIVRVHDVKFMKRVATMADALKAV